MKTTEVQAAASKHTPERVLRVGDLIVAYRKGYHVITRIELREKEDGDLYEMDPLVYYKQVCDTAGVRTKHAKVEHVCDISYCGSAAESIQRQKDSINAVEQTLRQYQLEK